MILFRVTAAAGDAFVVERSDELVTGKPVELLRVVAERVEMPDRLAVFQQTRWLDAGNLLEIDGQVVGVLAPASGFLYQLLVAREGSIACDPDHSARSRSGVFWIN